MLYSSIVNAAFNYVILTTKQFNIDESHAVRHSLDVYHIANKIYDNEVYYSPFLKQQKNIIMCSAILHDMCDKKYVDVNKGLYQISCYMQPYLNEEELNTVNQIISHMSYSYVKKNGYPKLDQYNLAYHIVRESDLLAGYDVERCILYQMMHNNDNYLSSLKITRELFETRMFNYLNDSLFVNEYSKKLAEKLDSDSRRKLADIDDISRSFLI